MADEISDTRICVILRVRPPNKQEEQWFRSGEFKPILRDASQTPNPDKVIIQDASGKEYQPWCHPRSCMGTCAYVRLPDCVCACVHVYARACVSVRQYANWHACVRMCVCVLSKTKHTPTVCFLCFFCFVYCFFGCFVIMCRPSRVSGSSPVGDSTRSSAPSASR